MISVVLLLVCACAAQLQFITFADWGGESYAPFTTQSQLAVAQAMAATSPEFVLAVGDNFYNDGVSSSSSQRFQSTFEDVYTGTSLQVPWYVVAGNHDYKGNVDAQVAYTNQSNTWTFPSYYYSFTKTFVSPSSGKNVAVQFVMIDTVLLSGSWDNFEPQPLHDNNPLVASLQWNWIRNTLHSSKADWVFVAGHYPIWSVAEHGPTQDLVQNLDPLLQKYGVSAYLCGHEHNVQLFQGPALDYIVTGAGHALKYSKKYESMVPSSIPLVYYYPPDKNFGPSDGMFTFMTIVDEHTMNTTYVSSDGTVQAQYVTKNRR